MPITLTNPTIGATNYPAVIAANFAEIQAAINSLLATVSALGGDAALLITDVVDRDGIVGSRSYVVDEANYEGGSSIDIGHRPAFDSTKGDQDLSIAWGTYGGERQRVTMTGDATLDASGITTGLPKTIYIGIPSDGTPQFFEDAITPNVLYIYSCSWDAFNLTDFVRMAPILMANDTLRDLADQQREYSVFDTETDWLEHAESETSLITPGDSEDNEIGIRGAREIRGFFIDFPGDQEDGLEAPAGEDNKLVLKITAEGTDWTDEIEIDASQEENFFQVEVLEEIGNDRFVTEAVRFKLELVSVGADVISARRFLWGYYWRPILGAAMPVDSDLVDLI